MSDIFFWNNWVKNSGLEIKNFDVQKIMQIRLSAEEKFCQKKFKIE